MTIGVVDLPVVPAALSLREAFAVMRERHRSAVVYVDQGLWLVEAIAIVRAIHEGTQRLGDVTERESLTRPPRPQVMMRVAYDAHTMRDVEPILERSEQSLAIVAMEGGSAFVVAQHEGVAARLEPTPRTCYCIHRPPPRCYGTGRQDHGDCSVGHQGTIRCI